ncbi:hypothetical protein PMAC_001915 [Pneumocystis sp. 'macacae']|nr:hypothetical protein PMAC_001915 [Pneumocystis sp. 'macacae']
MYFGCRTVWHRDDMLIPGRRQERVCGSRDQATFSACVARLHKMPTDGLHVYLCMPCTRVVHTPTRSAIATYTVVGWMRHICLVTGDLTAPVRCALASMLCACIVTCLIECTNMPWLFESWYMDVPIVTRLFITGAVATRIAMQLGNAISVVFFMALGDYPQTGESRGAILSPLVSLTFLASPLSFCLIYLWSRRNPSVRLSFLGLFVFNAPYLPWILLWFSFVLHNTIPKGDLLGMFVGHIYYYLKDVVPTISS